jgi:Na+/H+ antiporter NhaC
MYSTKTGWNQRKVCLVFLGLIGSCLVLSAIAAAQESDSPAKQETQTGVIEEWAGSPDESTTPAETREPRDPRTFYKLWVLLPAIVAILLAIFTRQVVPALVVGVLVGAYMMVPCLPLDSPYDGSNPVVGGFRLAAEKYVIGSIIDPDRDFGKVKIIVFTVIIGFMVGVIGRNGGTAGLVKLVAGETDSPRRGALTAWLAGLVVFFDDYANTMIVGPTMRSIFDRLKISRAKLAYIVDSTAAPVASIALVGTWVGAEIGYIGDGFDMLGADRPEFLAGVAPMEAFIQSLAYRFYPILALVLVFWIALTGRDFGPMKKAQAKALAGQEDRPYESTSPQLEEGAPRPRWWLGLIPVLVLLGMTVAVLFFTGRAGGGEEAIANEGVAWWQSASEILRRADANLSIFYGALLAAITAVILTLAARACSTKDVVDAGLEGMARMFPAIVILVLAWALSRVEQELMLGQVAQDYLEAANFPAHWLPLAIFVAAALVSFATGTSWATMGILCPIAVTVTAGLAADLDPDAAIKVFYAAVGSVLAGSIFGDHCSPISDTTVLSSVASGCRHESHVWTQIPYALLAAIVAMGVGDVMCSRWDWPWYSGLAAGTVLLLLVVLIVGRRAKPALAAEPLMP